MSDTDLTKDRPYLTEWSLFYDPRNIKDLGSHLKCEADEDERKNLARRFGVISLNALTAHVVVENTKDSHISRVSGTLKASLTQECVVSGDPVTTDIEEEFEGWFADPEKIVSINKARREKAIKDGNELPIVDEHEDPEPLVDGKIDIGELISQSLSLCIPAYPRADGAEFENTADSDDEEKNFDNPFAALKDWKDSFKK